MNEFATPLTYEYLDTYDSLLYRIGIYPMQFSQYAAWYVVKIVLQLFPAVIGLFLLISLYKSELKNAISVCSNRKYFSGIILALLPIALILLIGMASFGGQSRLSLPISAFGLAFAWFWGDHMAFQFIQGRDHIFPISLVMKWQLSPTEYEAVFSSSGDAPLSWLPYVLIPVLIAGACFIIGSVLYDEQPRCKTFGVLFFVLSL